MLLSGAEILIQSLKSQGVQVIFGYPGGNVLDIYDELYKHSDEIRHVLASHEQGAVHGAEGYARSTGKTGAVIATSGPGATNLVTGLADALLDSTPLVAITGNVPQHLLGKDSFQEVDITNITVAVTKHNFQIKHASEISSIVQKAFEIANSGRPGPVLIDIPKNISTQIVEYVPKDKFTRFVRNDYRPEAISKAVELINQSKRPVIYFGGGIKSSGAKEALRAFAHKTDTPMTCTTMGLSTFAYNDPHLLGLLGMHGRPVCNLAIDKADLIIAVGTRFSDRITGDKAKFASQAKIIHIELDGAELNKNIDVFLELQGDAKNILERLTALVEEKEHKPWREQLALYKTHTDIPHKTKHNLVDPRKIIKEVAKITNYQALVVTDVGQHQMLTAQNYRFTENSAFISSCGLGTMGFGLGAANGVQIAHPEKPVVLFTGDGCFHMNMNELAVSVTENLPIVIVLFNNSVLGMVRQWQTLFYDKRYSATDLNRKTDYVKLAEAFGATGLRVENDQEIIPALTQAFATAGPVVIDCIVDKNYGVFPFIPAGKSFKDIILDEALEEGESHG